MDPAWWFTGIFFAVLIKLAPKFWDFSVSRLKRTLRNRHARYKRVVKNSRHNIAAVNYQSIKSQAFFVMFLITIALYVTWYAAGPLREIQKTSLMVFIICIIPMYVVQVFWLIHDNLARDLVKEYHKLRVTRRSSKDAQSAPLS
jgi:ABC-type spermidine/putrescine transport system permease subunit I